MKLLVAVLSGLIVALAGVLLGAWWAPFLVGAAIGLMIRRALLAVPLGAACGLLAWLAPLLGQQVRYGLAPSADSLAAIMGFDHQGGIPVVLTLVVGLLLGLCGAWLASAVRLFVLPAPR